MWLFGHLAFLPFLCLVNWICQKKNRAGENEMRFLPALFFLVCSACVLSNGSLLFSREKEIFLRKDGPVVGDSTREKA